ncbi:MAG: type II toxin-antitoxin system RelE/ParE family toxin [Aestuariivirga sp.]
MSDYILSPETISDLQNIYDFTVGEWGDAQAAKYLGDIYAVFERLVQHPSIGRLRAELGDGLRSIPVGAHVIFFMPWKNDIAIVRVLHGARDVETAFRE